MFRLTLPQKFKELSRGGQKEAKRDTKDKKQKGKKENKGNKEKGRTTDAGKVDNSASEAMTSSGSGIQMV